MDNNIRQILQKQQNLEYLKKQNTLSQVKAKQTDNRLSPPYVQKILSYIKKLYFSTGWNGFVTVSAVYWQLPCFY